MIIGANPTDGHPVFASQMKRRLREGAAKLIIVDPREIDLVNNSVHIKADYHLKLKPGTNVADDQRYITCNSAGRFDG